MIEPIYRWAEGWEADPGNLLDAPVLVVSLDGWVDAGGAASETIKQLRAEAAATTVVTFTAENFIDQRARRPVVRLVDGVNVEMTWPTMTISAGTDDADSSVLFLDGPEPDFHWPTFVDAVVSIARQCGVRMVVGLGAFPAPTPHTRPMRLASTVPPESADLVGRVGTVRGTLDVPAGVHAALEVGFGQAGIPAITLWARVPHYVSAMPYPDASAALIEGLNSVSGLLFDASSFHADGVAARRQIDELIAGNHDHVEMVRQLEAAVEAEQAEDAFDMEVPSGDEIAAELEQFLRGEGG